MSRQGGCGEYRSVLAEFQFSTTCRPSRISRRSPSEAMYSATNALLTALPSSSMAL
jgi:hypothetical protein